jgi:hypothetical protein
MAAPYSAASENNAAVHVVKEALPEISVPSGPPFEQSDSANGIQVTVSGPYPTWPTDMTGKVPE